jgi:succinate dehydrogenase hydrophobic anchor subunit
MQRTLNAEIVSTTQYDEAGQPIPTWTHVELAVSGLVKSLYHTHENPRHLSRSSKRYTFNAILALLCLVVVALSALFGITYSIGDSIHGEPVKEITYAFVGTGLISGFGLILFGLNAKSHLQQIKGVERFKIRNHYNELMNALRKVLKKDLSGFNPDKGNLREMLSDKLESFAREQVRLEEQNPSEVYRAQQKTYLLIQTMVDLGYFYWLCETENQKTPKALVFNWAKGKSDSRPWRGPDA